MRWMISWTKISRKHKPWHSMWQKRRVSCFRTFPDTIRGGWISDCFSAAPTLTQFCAAVQFSPSKTLWYKSLQTFELDVLQRLLALFPFTVKMGTSPIWRRLKTFRIQIMQRINNIDFDLSVANLRMSSNVFNSSNVSSNLSHTRQWDAEFPAK